MNIINKLVIGTVFLSMTFVALYSAPTMVLACNSQYYLGCYNDSVYWFDECNLKVEFVEQCYSDEVCSNGQCVLVDIDCYDNEECGTDGIVGNPFCQGNAVYKNYKTYTCNNAGTTSSYCTNATTAQLQNTCTTNQTCTGGSCTNVNINCYTNSECGTNGFVGDPFCQGNSVYRNYKTYTCNNPGTSSSSCTNSTVAQLQSTCLANQTCTNGSCTSNCTANYEQRCVGTSLYWFNSCGVQGSYIGTCGNNCTPNYQQRCVGTSMYWFDSCGVQGSYIGTCGNNCTPNYQQRCVGTSMYWFDSCGVQGSYIGTCGQTNSTLTVTKTVKNLTTNTSFVNSVYANPSDVLMFMITLQNNGNQDSQNVVVRDSLPSNLIYSNQLVIARSNNASNSYSGDIMSSLNLNTILAGQTVTVTYQVQVAGAANFVYGTTTLNNLVNTTSSNTSYIPTASASVIVTRSGVAGASTVATGLTNNFWVDSFLLPLLLTLIGLWMWRAGMFIRIEKWLDSRRKNRRGYKAEKELSNRIAKISGVQNNKESEESIWQ
ncbi:MAG: hypothetical protein WC711_00405 [Candidatus Staskawiczbacteria bacterium]|jgi:uncharacterized repeat protein (TIGR01451 family)